MALPGLEQIPPTLPSHISALENGSGTSMDLALKPRCPHPLAAHEASDDSSGKRPEASSGEQVYAPSPRSVPRAVAKNEVTIACSFDRLRGCAPLVTPKASSLSPSCGHAVSQPGLRNQHAIAELGQNC